MIELPTPHTYTFIGDNKAPTDLYTADQLRTYGDQRAAEARELMREELLPLLKRMANNYGWVEHTPEYPNDDGWRSVGHDGLMMIRKLEKLP